MYDFSIFVGRFQPFHRGHLHNILTALKHSEKIIINIGSSFNAPSIKNPFSFKQRKQMIESDLKIAGIDLSRVEIEPLADFFYQESKWEASLRENVRKHVDGNKTVAIVGYIKDASSYYINSFPEWDYIAVDNYKNYNATEFREAFYLGDILSHYMCSKSIHEGSYKFLNSFMKTKKYENLVAENSYVTDYKKSWQKAPYKPNLVTVDAMVVVNDHILLMRRKNFPGRNLWALPGGFLECDEVISQAIMRELFEETNICLTTKQLAVARQAEVVFDYPERSVRGRTISHTGLFIFDKWPKLPQIKAADDANDAKWFSISSIINNMYDRMLEDHYQIITVLLEERYKKV